MSFHPLPAEFAEHLSGLDSSVDTVVELGCGDGALSRRIREFAPACLGLDRRGPDRGTSCDIVGDARRPPLRTGSISVLVAGNLVRHLTPRQDMGRWLAHWRRLLRPGGKLYILEDEPDRNRPAERNFTDFQDFLARLVPEGRGPLMTLTRFRQLARLEADGGPWSFGHQRNGEPVDQGAVLSLLGGGTGPLTGPPADLYRAIQTNGIAPGGYWWAAVGPFTNGDARAGRTLVP